MIKVEINDRVYSIAKKENKYFLNQEDFEVDFYQRNKNQFHIIHNHVSLSAEVLSFDPQQKKIELAIGGKTFHCKISGDHDPLIEKMKAAAGNEALHREVVSPMPGLIQKIFVKEGDAVTSNAPLMILNAMKMENVLKSPVNGTVAKICIEESEQVEKGKVLIRF